MSSLGKLDTVRAADTKWNSLARQLSLYLKRPVAEHCGAADVELQLLKRPRVLFCTLTVEMPGAMLLVAESTGQSGRQGGCETAAHELIRALQICRFEAID